jgi:GntR family transcriptional repressor for pyruvate dehydrogenase complex
MSPRLLERSDRIDAGERVSALYPRATSLARPGMRRLKVREAVKALQAKNVLHVARGRGTYVNPVDQWTALEALGARANVHRESGTGRTLPERLIEALRIVEIGAGRSGSARSARAAGR